MWNNNSLEVGLREGRGEHKIDKGYKIFSSKIAFITL